ncbi:MAG: hypothetical protein PHC92_10270 [Syntrophomonadaceae bacterium]|nr:hypothetical protein [Syntrophomonadaceae bacterium]MDD3023445.1 hypothetical protein [Syntrophomonadaceae bacterium]
MKADRLEETIRKLQENMKGNLFYAHLYQANELIVVYNKRFFKATPVKSTWQKLIAYGNRCISHPFGWTLCLPL